MSEGSARQTQRGDGNSAELEIFERLGFKADMDLIRDIEDVILDIEGQTTPPVLTWKSSNVPVKYKFELPIQLFESGCVLTYTFSTAFYDISFGITLVKRDGLRVELLKPDVYADAATTPVNGSIDLEEEGQLILTWDNSASYYTHRGLSYTVTLKRPDTAVTEKAQAQRAQRAIERRTTAIQEQGEEIQRFEKVLKASQEQLSVLENEHAGMRRRLEALETEMETCRAKAKEAEQKKRISLESSQLWKRHIEVLGQKWPSDGQEGDIAVDATHPESGEPPAKESKAASPTAAETPAGDVRMAEASTGEKPDPAPKSDVSPEEAFIEESGACSDLEMDPETADEVKPSPSTSNNASISEISDVTVRGIADEFGLEMTKSDLEPYNAVVDKIRKEEPQLLFVVEKSSNSNVVVYWVNLDPTGPGGLSETDPVKVGWIMCEQGVEGSPIPREDLTLIERNTAYGTTVNPVPGNPGQYKVTLSALPDREIIVCLEDEKPAAYCTVDGKENTRLQTVRAQLQTNWYGLPNVQHIDIVGFCPTTGEVVTERKLAK